MICDWIYSVVSFKFDHILQSLIEKVLCDAVSGSESFEVLLNSFQIDIKFI